MAGAYSLAQDAHVRGDVLYRLFPVKAQAWIDLILYIFFFFPGKEAVEKSLRENPFKKDFPNKF